jgi:DNA-binding GntR family transcriptional regulator
MNSNDFVAIEEPPLHAAVYRLVRTNIESGRLPPGTSLTEHWLSQELSLSRMPVGRALQRLERDGLLVRDGARGFVVGGAPRLTGSNRPELDIPDSAFDLVRGRSEWQKIWDRVQGDLVACMPFGRYKIVEMTMATHYGVSRTVTRDLLARLEILGLIERAGRSQCFLRQLTPELMSELYEVRRLLEPAALLQAAPFHKKEELARMRAELLEAEAHYPNVSASCFAAFEEDLHIRSTAACPNLSLVTLLRQTQMLVLATNRLIPLYLGMPGSEPFFAEHRLVLELLLNGAPEAAALALEAHLRSAVRKQHLRLIELRAHRPVVPLYLVAGAKRS